jgi:hypothetical protein
MIRVDLFIDRKNTIVWYFLLRILLLSLSWFFIGYWILKTGLDFYPGPNFFLDLSYFFRICAATSFPLTSAASTVPPDLPE